MKLILGLVFLIVFGFGFFAFMRWIPYFVSTRMEPFDAMLTQAEVRASDKVRTRLEAQAARRHVWGAVGAGAGVSVALAASDIRVLEAADGFAMTGWFFGMAVGQSVSALFPVNPPRGPVRVSAMQPHGMTDYLHRREVVAEVGLAVLGWASVAVGTLVLTDLVDIPISGDNAAALVVAGALLSLVATTTILVQRRLLAAPLHAQDEDGLICADIILSVGLRDLLAITMAMTLLVTWTTLFLPGRDWWLVATFAAAAVISIGTAFGVRKRPNLAPVARSLSARSRTA